MRCNTTRETTFAGIDGLPAARAGLLHRLKMLLTARPRRLFAVLVGALLTLPLLAGPASAHAVLKSSDPGSGADLSRSADSVTLHFDEPVTLLPSGIKVLDGNGKRVDRGDAGHPGDSKDARVSLRSNLPQGSYLVDWRVVSADSHPVGGAYSFSIGAPGQVAKASGTGGDSTVGFLLGLSRLLTFVSLALLVGAVGFVLTCWRGAWQRRGVRRLLFASCAGVATTAVTGLLLQAPYSAGLTLRDSLDPTLLRTVVESPYGHAAIARFLLAGMAGGWLVLLFRAGALRIVQASGVVLGLALLATLPLGGHPNTGAHRALTLSTDIVHLASMSLWVGGLAVLAGMLIRPNNRDDLTTVVARFSKLAFISVAALVASGVVAALVQVGSLPALVGTHYGRVLMIKVALVAVVLLVAAASRNWVQRQQAVKASVLADEETLATLDRELVLAGIGVEESTVAAQSGTGFPPAGDLGASSVPAPRGEGVPPGDGSDGEPAAQSPSPRELRRLRWSVLAEVVVVIGILAVTAVLVVTPPAKTVYGSTNPAADAAAASTSATVHTGPVQVRVIAGPTTPTATRELRMFVSTYDKNVQLQNVPELTGEMRLPAKGLGPLPVTFTRTAAGRFSVDSVDLPVAGQWQLTLNVRVDDFNSYTGSTLVTVR